MRMEGKFGEMQDKYGERFHREISKSYSYAPRVFKYAPRDMECPVLSYQIRCGGLNLGISC